MGFWERFGYKKVTVKNTEPNTVMEIGVDELTDAEKYFGENWVDLTPEHIAPTIKNCRKAADFACVSGIIHNLILKTISSFKIEGNNEKALKHILDRDKDWDLKNKSYEVLWNNIVDGECFYQYWYDTNKLNIRELAFDGDNYRIKKLHDENGKVQGIVQLTKINRKTNKDWKNKEYYEIDEELYEKTAHFERDEFTNPILIKIHGRGKGLVRNVIDLAYFIDSLTEQMPNIVFKAANTLFVTVGNDTRKEIKLSEEAKDKIVENSTDYHKKGVILLPYGIEPKMIGNTVLPDIPSYIKSLKSLIYEGLITPESLYSSESSNRSTAEVQLTDNRTGHVLFIEFAQEFLKKWIEREIFDKELKLNKLPEGSVWIEFKTEEEDLNNTYGEKKNLNNQNDELKENEESEEKEVDVDE